MPPTSKPAAPPVLPASTADAEAYAEARLAEIRRWCDTEPEALSRVFGRALSPAARAVQQAIPDAWLRAALDGVRGASSRLADQRSVLRAAGVDTLAALRDGPLARCDRAAATIARRGTWLAGGSGALFGIAGAAGLVADVPTLLMQAFRVIHRTGLSYGEDCAEPALARLPITIFALASANTLAEKQAALRALALDQTVAAAALRDGLERAAERELAKEAAAYSIRNVSAAITRRLGLAKAGGAVPLVGALVGGAVNAWYLNEVATAARIAFQLRWLARRHGLNAALAALAPQSDAGADPSGASGRLSRRPSPPSS